MRHQVRLIADVNIHLTFRNNTHILTTAVLPLSWIQHRRAKSLTVSQVRRRDSKEFLVVDEDCGIPTTLVEHYRSHTEAGSLAQQDPRTYLLSMSEYDKAQSYDVYGMSNPITFCAIFRLGIA